ncbi:hypothetical protein [Nocardia sp. NBC_01377]|uniref:alpha-L-rhamnosidase-related protein n=1 Tax=Nocardia sp. NBC_01377 TaxID=2903595 RepID=UPI00386DDEB8
MAHKRASWLSQIELGATTIWETREGYDNAGNGKESHNPYALGCVADWLTEELAGMSSDSPGYRHIRFAPVVAQQLSTPRVRSTHISDPHAAHGSATGTGYFSK